MIANRRLSSPALALVIAAIAAPTASARPIDLPPDGQPAPARVVEPQVRVIEVPTGFDWGGAGIGAGAMLAATGLGGALVLNMRRRAHPSGHRRKLGNAPEFVGHERS